MALPEAKVEKSSKKKGKCEWLCQVILKLRKWGKVFNLTTKKSFMICICIGFNNYSYGNPGGEEMNGMGPTFSLSGPMLISTQNSHRIMKVSFCSDDGSYSFWTLSWTRYSGMLRFTGLFNGYSDSNLHFSRCFIGPFEKNDWIEQR